MNITRRTLTALALLSTLGMASCTKQGCTDSVSYNYDSDATEDDGSCTYYYGGKNYGQIDVGSEIDLNSLYDIYIDNVFLGTLTYYFPSGLNCGNPKAIGQIYEAGSHLVKAVGSGGSPIRQGSVYLDPQDCKVVLIEDLQLVNGGNSAGYNCSGGNCNYVSSGASYSSLSECQSACSGGGSSLNDKWLASDGTGISISGSNGSFYSFSSNWQLFVNNGTISYGSLKLKEISQVSATTWNCKVLFLHIVNGVPESVAWSSDGTITMSSSGNTIYVAATSPFGSMGSASYTRQ